MTHKASVTLGYDPGGDGRHGVAALHTDERGTARAEAATVTTAEAAFGWLAARLPPDPNMRTAIGIDTLAVWSSGSAGWRPADEWLRGKYRRVRNSVASGLESHNPRLVQQAMYLFMSSANRQRAEGDCSTEGRQRCARCPRALRARCALESQGNDS